MSWLVELRRVKPRRRLQQEQQCPRKAQPRHAGTAPLTRVPCWGRAVWLLPVALGALAAQRSSYSWLGALKRLHWSFPGSHGAARPGQGHWGHTGGPDVLVASVGLPLSLCRHCSLLGLKCFSVWFNQSQVQLRGSSPRPCPCPAAFPFGNVMAPLPSRAVSLLLSCVCPCPCRDGAGAGPAAPGEDLGVPE